MATVSFSITGSGTDWSGSFSVATTSNQIKNVNGRPSAFTSESQTFNINQFQSYGESGVEYVTWRSVDISGQPEGGPNYLNVYPKSGFSFDLWSSNFYTDVITNSATWDTINGQSYSLSPTKFTVVYNYDTNAAIYLSKGGTITFTVS